MRFDEARPAPDDPALRYSVADFSEIIFAAFEAAGVRTVVEIGAEAGAFTTALLDWTGGRGGRLYAIDPAPSDLVRRTAAGSPGLTLVERTSHDALDDLEPLDAYIIDGDHNYFTVAGELARIAATCERAGTQPLIVAQDVGWPSGSRDLYYAPESLPAEAVHPYDYCGAVPWEVRTGPGGFRGEGHFAFAKEEGGPANGVCAAVEDFLSGRPDLEVISLPCVFGLAVIFPTAAPWADEVRRVVGPFDDHPLLSRLEANRILLFLRVVELQDQLEVERQSAADRIAALEERLDAATTELDLVRESRRAGA